MAQQALRTMYAVTLRKEVFHLDARYTDASWLGAGAYGSVVSCTDTVNLRKVAIKSEGGRSVRAACVR